MQLARNKMLLLKQFESKQNVVNIDLNTKKCNGKHLTDAYSKKRDTRKLKLYLQIKYLRQRMQKKMVIL